MMERPDVIQPRLLAGDFYAVMYMKMSKWGNAWREYALALEKQLAQIAENLRAYPDSDLVGLAYHYARVHEHAVKWFDELQEVKEELDARKQHQHSPNG